MKCYFCLVLMEALFYDVYLHLKIKIYASWESFVGISMIWLY